MMKRTMRVLGGGFCLLATTSQAFGQASLVKDKTATSGSTDVAKEGFQTAEAPPPEAPVDETVAKVSAGVFFATGNARSLALTAAGAFRLRRAANQYSADLAANYAEAKPAATPTAAAPVFAPTVENYQGRVRYDRFLAKRWALFVQESGRRDRFQGLDLRLNFDPGVSHYLIIEEKQHLTFDAGYDLQYDVRTQAAITAAAQALVPSVIASSEVRHALRLYAGYDNSLNEHVRFETNLEYLQAFAEVKNFRLNWVNSLSANLSSAFAVAVGFTLRYDNNPLAGIEQLDTITTGSLVYTLQ